MFNLGFFCSVSLCCLFGGGLHGFVKCLKHQKKVCVWGSATNMTLAEDVALSQITKPGEILFLAWQFRSLTLRLTTVIH